MDRRGFLKTLGALALAAGLPLIASRWDDSGQIIGGTFYLDEPLVLDVPDYFVIQGCTFRTNPGFVGDSMLSLIGESKQGNIIDCSFFGDHLPNGGYCIDLRQLSSGSSA